MNNGTSIGQLKYFLKEMFQFNANDLDFGIYRIYNLRRKEIENFIDGKKANCLEPIILRALELVANTGKRLQAIGPAARQKKITGEIKSGIYDHILAYFEMYYSNGDFGYNNRSRHLYKVPYEADYDGTDTLFHWKHKGSIYIKTGNSFNAIKFKIKQPRKVLELRLETNGESRNEGVARNNNKDTKLKQYRFNRFEEKEGVTRIVFNLSDSSTTKADLFKLIFKEVFKSNEKLNRYLIAGGKPVFNELPDNYSRVQEGITRGIRLLRVNRKTLLDKINKNFDKGQKIEIIKKEGLEIFSDVILETIYNIDQKLNSFYIGNDSDYFIHENLQEFLTNEKERYIKNYILCDLESILNGKLDNATIMIAKAFDLVSTRIIGFLSAMEEFQKKLFTMKKKIVESEYCLTIDNIDEKLYAKIVRNKSQLQEWQNLFGLQVKTAADLRAQPTLVLDTKFFRKKNGANPFKDKILEPIEGLDEKTNGVMINSENYQALTLLQERYKEQVKCIYIDPPYNTGGDGFVYKDNFKHSSWISFLENRLAIAKFLMAKNGNIISSIGVEEVFNLKQLFDRIFNENNFVELFSWIRTLSPSNLSKKSKKTIEYLLCYEREKNVTLKYKGVANTLANNNPLIKKNNETKILVFPKDKVDCNIKGNHTLKKGMYGTKTNKVELLQDVNIIDSVFQNDIELKANFIWEPKNLAREIEKGTRIIFKTKKSLAPRYDKKEYDLPVPKNLIDDSDGVKTNDYEKNRLIDLGFKGRFDYPKPTSLISYVTGFNTGDNDIILDFYAGSGTTANAILESNKKNNQNQKFLLVEVAKYFDDVTKPRVLKNIYSDNWKDGKPLNNDGSVHTIFKYNVLEQYEDVLDAIEPCGSGVPKNLSLKYVYRPELNKISSTLDLSKPFTNRIRYGQPAREGFIDVAETYNYLQGYKVKSIKTCTLNKKYYKVIETLFSIIIWRNISPGEDDSKNVISIAERYPGASGIKINFDFNLPSGQNSSELEVRGRKLSVGVIHPDVFDQ